MERGMLVPLSFNEESTLRRVAHGISKPKDLRADMLARLKVLQLVEERDGRVQLTSLGERRTAASPPTAAPS